MIQKERLQTFIDAVVAIIMTIMVLEIKAPEKPELSELLSELPYLYAYIISAITICVGWHNQSILLNRVKKITNGIFWAEIFWILCASLIPVATAWVSEFPFSRTTEYFYMFTYVIFSFSFLSLEKVGYHYVKKQTESVKQATLTKKSDIFNDTFNYGMIIIGLISVYFWPLSGIIVISLIVIFWLFHPYK